MTRQSARKRTAEAAPQTTAREQLLRATGAVMTERGTTEVSFSEIAQRSGVNSALIKYYFGNKDGLFLELVRQVLAPSVAQLQKLVTMPYSPKEKLRIHLSGVVNSYFRFPYINRLMHQLLAGSEESRRIIAEEFVRPVVAAQQAILEEGQAAGAFRPIEPMLFYFHVNGACDHLFFSAYALKYVFGVQFIGEDLRRRYVEQLYDIIVRGIEMDESPIA